MTLQACKVVEKSLTKKCYGITEGRTDGRTDGRTTSIPNFSWGITRTVRKSNHMAGIFDEKM